MGRGSVCLVKVGISCYEEKEILVTQNKGKDCQKAWSVLLTLKQMPLIWGKTHQGTIEQSGHLDSPTTFMRQSEKGGGMGKQIWSNDF